MPRRCFPAVDRSPGQRSIACSRSAIEPRGVAAEGLQPGAPAEGGQIALDLASCAGTRPRPRRTVPARAARRRALRGRRRRRGRSRGPAWPGRPPARSRDGRRRRRRDGETRARVPRAPARSDVPSALLGEVEVAHVSGLPGLLDVGVSQPMVRAGIVGIALEPRAAAAGWRGPDVALWARDRLRAERRRRPSDEGQTHGRGRPGWIAWPDPSRSALTPRARLRAPGWARAVLDSWHERRRTDWRRARSRRSPRDAGSCRRAGSGGTGSSGRCRSP